MHKHERDAVRQVLETALKNLGEDAAGGETSSGSMALSADRGPSSDSRSSEAPVIIVVAGDLKGRSQDTAGPRPVSLRDTEEPPKVNSLVSDHFERKVSHPGLERFTMIEVDSHPSAPKTCFMEPARVCVNSGACEMRGF